MQDIMPGTKLTAEQADAQVAASRKTGADRYSVTGPHADSLYRVWDHQDAEYLTDRDGQQALTETDAHDLAAEYINS